MIKRIFGMVGLVVAVFALSACAGNIEFEIDDDYTYVTLTFDEEQVAQVLERIVTGGSPPLLQEPRVRMTNGAITVSGTHVTWMGDSYPASLTFTLFERDGHVSARITAFDFNGAPINEQRIERLNESLADGFAQGAEGSNSEITDVTITSTELSISSRTPHD